MGEIETELRLGLAVEGEGGRRKRGEVRKERERECAVAQQLMTLYFLVYNFHWRG